MIHLETDNVELFAELANFGWVHPISKFVRPGELMQYALQTAFKCTTIRVALLPQDHQDPLRLPNS